MLDLYKRFSLPFRPNGKTTSWKCPSVHCNRQIKRHKTDKKCKDLLFPNILDVYSINHWSQRVASNDSKKCPCSLFTSKAFKKKNDIFVERFILADCAALHTVHADRHNSTYSLEQTNDGMTRILCWKIYHRIGCCRTVELSPFFCGEI